MNPEHRDERTRALLDPQAAIEAVFNGQTPTTHYTQMFSELPQPRQRLELAQTAFKRALKDLEHAADVAGRTGAILREPLRTDPALKRARRAFNRAVAELIESNAQVGALQEYPEAPDMWARELAFSLQADMADMAEAYGMDVQSDRGADS